MSEVKRTIKEWLEALSNTNTSSEEDSTKMQNLLRMLGFSKAVVTCGCVYLEGQGVPVDIHSAAKALLGNEKKEVSPNVF